MIFRILKTGLLLFLSIGLYIPLKAQENTYKSFSTIQDSAYIGRLLYKAAILQNKDPDSCILLARQALNESSKISYNYGIGKGLTLVAVGYRNIGHYAQSLNFFKEAIPFIEKQKKDRDLNLAIVYTTMYGSYFPLGYYDSGAIVCYKVIALYNKPENKVMRSANNEQLIDAYQFLGTSWARLKYYQQALEYLKKAEQLSRENKEQHGLVNILNTIGVVYLEKGKLDTAYALFKEGLRLANQNKGSTDLLTMNIASVYMQQGRPKEAIPILKNLLRNNDTTAPFNQSAIDIANILAKSYYDLKQYDSALYVLLKEKKRAAAFGIKENGFTTNYILAQIYAAKGAPGKSYTYLLDGIKLLDTLTNTDKIQALNILEFKLQAAEKNNEISQKQLLISYQENKIRQNNLLIGILAISGLLLVVIIIVIYKNNKHKRYLQEERINRLKTEQEIIQLKAIMKGEEKERGRIARELHDGFVSQLSAIKMNFSVMPNRYHVLSSAADYKKNLSYLEETISELRKTAHNLMPEILMNGGLVEAVQIYCERIAATHKPDIDFQLYGFVPRLNTEFELALYRMIQELLQNILKHANATLAIVQINCTDEVLSVTIEDNGIGFPEDSNNHTSSAGLKILETRVRALNGSIDINSYKNIGTTIYLEFDIHQIKEIPNNAY